MLDGKSIFLPPFLTINVLITKRDIVTRYWSKEPETSDVFNVLFDRSIQYAKMYVLKLTIVLSIGHDRYINTLTWYRGFWVKIIFFIFFCLSIPTFSIHISTV